MPQSSIAAWLQRASNSPGIVTTQQPRSESTLRQLSNEHGKHEAIEVAHEEAPLAISPALHESQQRQHAALPDNAHISPCKHDRIDSFRRLNTLLLPIPYPQSFYDETVQDPVIASLTRVIIWRDSKSPMRLASLQTGHKTIDAAALEGQIVAGIRCRLLSASPESVDEETVLYISTIGVLAPFRRHSLASQLLADVALVAVGRYEANSIMAHVWEKNEDAIEWYTKRGFEVVKKEEGYYRRLAPNTVAFLMRREITANDVLTWPKADDSS